MKKVRRLVAILCLVVSCLSIGAFAATNSQTVQAIMSFDTTVKYNNQVQNFKDANGEQVFPLILNGTTYLPVRAVAEMLNVIVDWDGKTKTVYLGTKDMMSASDSASMEVYNDSTVAGSIVLSAAKNPASISPAQLAVGVITSADTQGKKYDTTHTYKGKEAGSEINTSAQFGSYLVKNANDVIIGVLFVQNNVTDLGANLSGVFSDTNAIWIGLGFPIS